MAACTKVRQRDREREAQREAGVGFSRDDESWHKLGVIEVNAANEMEMWDAGG